MGHCVHRIAMHPARPGVLFMQKHWDVMRSDDAGESWREISGNLPSDFGFPIEVHPAEPETIYVVPIKSDSEHYPPDARLHVYRSRSGSDEWEALTDGLPQRAVIDALEAGYPVLRGTIRDYATRRRRPFIRFFACEQDLSHEPPDAPLPQSVAAGAELFLIVGAMAGK